jgi:hypothetical protein
MENFTNIVHRSLDGSDPPRGIRCIYLHGFRLQGLLAPRVRKGSLELGLGCFLADGGPNWPLVAETQVPPQLLAPGVDVVPVALRPTPCSRYQLLSRCKAAEAHQVLELP